MLTCSTICACVPHLLGGNLSRSYYVSYKGTEMELNVSLDGFCTLQHEITSNTSWLGRSSKDVLRVLLNTYLAPPLILITLITNLLICAVLTRRHMVSPTNIILLAMALVDMLTGIFPLPWYLLSEFAHNWTVGWVCSSDSPAVANLVNLMTTTLPTIAHTVSIWLTVILAIQRWIYITFPMSVQRLCTNRTSVTSIAVLVALSTVFMSAWFYLDGPYTVATATEAGRPDLVVSCNFASQHRLFESMIYLRTLLVNLVPSVLLLVFTTLLVHGMRKAAKRRKQLLASRPKKQQQQQQQQQKQQQSATGTNSQRRREEPSNTTAMLTVVVGIFMVVELPMTVVMSLYALQLSTGQHMELMSYALPVINFAILVTYPANFFVYTKMSSQFRQTFAATFRRRSRREGRSRTPAGAEASCGRRTTRELPDGQLQPLCGPQAQTSASATVVATGEASTTNGDAPVTDGNVPATDILHESSMA